MIAAPVLVFCHSQNRDKTWEIQANGQRVGSFFSCRSPGKIQDIPLRRFGTGKVLGSLLEQSGEGSFSLTLAVLVRLPNRRKVVVDANGKSLGDWQGEWIRILGHPAGRVISGNTNHWDWISPSGKVLANWTRLPGGTVELRFPGLEPGQGYCRIVAVAWTWEVTQNEL